MNRLRNRLILIFVLATLGPWIATVWLSTALLDHSLRLASTRELDAVSRSLEATGRAYYQAARDALKEDVQLNQVAPVVYRLEDRAKWPAEVAAFEESGRDEQFLLEGAEGSALLYARREGAAIKVYRRALEVPMKRLSAQYGDARELVERSTARDLRRGFLTTFLVLAAGAWLVALVALVYWANRVSRPVQQLTAGLEELANGNLHAELPVERDDEIGSAMRAFNHTAEQLRQSRERLVFVTRLSTWQTLARKMAHEVKNSLTPIRLTMEELVARNAGGRDRFLEQAAQIVVEEVATLERRVRAFSEFAAEPPVRRTETDLNTLLEERIGFLRAAHPEVLYQTRLAASPLTALADADLLKGILTNLLENAAHAAGEGGVVLGRTLERDGKLHIEIHDSGPGLSLHARESLFEPTISFKKSGMGLGLSIARRSALLMNGDIRLIEGELGGAAFRVTLEPVKPPEPETPPPAPGRRATNPPVARPNTPPPSETAVSV